MLALLSGCASGNAQYNPAKPHHTPEGFKNNHTGSVTRSRSDFFRWQYLEDLPKPPQTPTPTVTQDMAFVQSNAKAIALRKKG